MLPQCLLTYMHTFCIATCLTACILNACILQVCLTGSILTTHILNVYLTGSILTTCILNVDLTTCIPTPGILPKCTHTSWMHLPNCLHSQWLPNYVLHASCLTAFILTAFILEVLSIITKYIYLRCAASLTSDLDPLLTQKSKHCAVTTDKNCSEFNAIYQV